MIIYYSEKTLSSEITSELKRVFPRGKISSNFFEIERASNIDYSLLMNYFICAISKSKNMYEAAITLPIDLEDRIPSWYVKSEKEIWIDPKSAPRGRNVLDEEIFTVKFHLYVNEKKIKSLPESISIPVEKAILGEFIEIRHSLIEGNEEPIDVFKSFYTNQSTNVPKTATARYLAQILNLPA